jgi:hypothetical protein
VCFSKQTISANPMQRLIASGIYICGIFIETPHLINPYYRMHFPGWRHLELKSIYFILPYKSAFRLCVSASVRGGNVFSSMGERKYPHGASDAK